MSSLFSRDSRPFTSFSGDVVNYLFTRLQNQLKSEPMTKFDPRTTQDDPEHPLEYLHRSEKRARKKVKRAHRETSEYAYAQNTWRNPAQLTSHAERLFGLSRGR